MPLLSTLSYSALSGLGGYYFGTALKGRRGDEDSGEFRDEILAEINERYESYLELEARITRAIKQFDLEQERGAREVALKEERILELERALECSVDQAHAGQGESGMLSEIESALDALEDTGTASIDDTSVREELERELDALRMELTRSLADKDAEIERQEEMISSLSSCVAGLEAELETASTQVASTLETSLASFVSESPEGGPGFGESAPDDADATGSITSDVARAFAEFELPHSGSEEEASEVQDSLDTRLAELDSLRSRVEELTPYVQRLEDAHERIAGLEQRCEELRVAREEDVIGLRTRVAELEAERTTLEQGSRERDVLQDKVAELAPYVDLLSETRFRVNELEEQCDDVRRTRDEEVFGLQARVAELEAEKALGAESGQAMAQLQEEVAELTPFVERLEEARNRIDELEEQCAEVRRARDEDVFALQARVAELEASAEHGPERAELAELLDEAREQLAEAQQQLVESQQLLSESHGELAESKRDLGEVGDKVFKLEQRCETIRKKKDEQIEVLRERVADLEPLREELGEKELALDEMEEKCTALERSKKRAANTMRQLREDLAETEDMVREVGGDPDVLRRERAERQELILSVFEELDDVVEGMKSQERRLDGLDKVYDATLLEQEQEIGGLEERLRDLYLLMETAGDVIAKLESAS